MKAREKETDVWRREIAPESEPPVGAGDGNVVELVRRADRRILLLRWCLLLHRLLVLLHTCGRNGPQGGSGTCEERGHGDGIGIEYVVPLRLRPFPDCSWRRRRSSSSWWWWWCWKDRIQIADGRCKMQGRTNICLKHFFISLLLIFSCTCKRSENGGLDQMYREKSNRFLLSLFLSCLSFCLRSKAELL